jgi:hypothetical protein
MNPNRIFYMIQITLIPTCSNLNSNGIYQIKIALIQRTDLFRIQQTCTYYVHLHRSFLFGIKIIIIIKVNNNNNNNHKSKQ